jgi:hypothetical protein
LPTNRGFESWTGIPYSVDMGRSAWLLDNDIPLPLMNYTKIVEQPADLNQLTDLYVNNAKAFMADAVQTDNPFFLCTMISFSVIIGHRHFRVARFIFDPCFRRHGLQSCARPQLRIRAVLQHIDSRKIWRRSE